MIQALVNIVFGSIFFITCALGILQMVFESKFINKKGKDIKGLLSKLETEDAQVKVAIWYPIGDFYNRIIFMNKLAAIVSRKSLKNEVSQVFPYELLKKIKRFSLITWTIGFFFVISVLIVYLY